MGWKDAPDYTPPEPPIWFWIVAAAITLIVIIVSVV